MGHQFIVRTIDLSLSEAIFLFANKSGKD